jgi:hypothetical protein
MDLSDSKYLLTFIILAAAWTIPWKGMALWKAARNKNKAWFVVLLLLNTLAILEIFYIFVISRKEQDNQDKM